jgi:hypothetical protein
VPADEILRFDLAIGAEDKVMLEQVRGVLPLDQTSLVSVQADRCGVEWRRRLAELVRVSPGGAPSRIAGSADGGAGADG